MSAAPSCCSRNPYKILAIGAFAIFGWVFLRDDEQKVVEILSKAGGTNVRAQDAPTPWLEPAQKQGPPG